MEQTKICEACKRELPISVFYRTKKGKAMPRCKACVDNFRKCNMCKKRKPLTDFGGNIYCKECYTKYSKNWYKNNSIKRNKYHTQFRNDRRLKVLNYISGGDIKCAECGFSDIRILQIDHTKGGGSQERKGVGNITTLYSKILKMDLKEVKENYQILCPNCNWIKKVENKGERGGLKPSLS